MKQNFTIPARRTLFMVFLCLLTPWMVLDYRGIIRYVELVPLGQHPEFDQALRVSRSLLAHTSQGVMP